MRHAGDDEDITFWRGVVYLIYAAYNDIRNSPPRQWNELEVADLIKNQDKNAARQDSAQ